MAKQYGSKYEYLKFLFLAHFCNPLWQSRLKRRKRRNYYNYKRVAAYLKKYRPFVKNLKIESQPTEDSTTPDTIFTIWWQGEENAPKIVSVCFDRLKKAYGDRVVILNEDNIRDWVRLPDFIWRKWEKGQITQANFSDICRISLLYQRGGIWFDATDYLTSPIPQWIEDADVFMYRDGDIVTPEKFIQICFLRAKRHNPLVKAWLDFIYEYWEKEEEIIDYFLHQFMMRYLVENNEEVKKLFYAMPQIEQTPTHLLWHFYRDEPYSDTLYQDSTKDTFFQKTSYKFKAATEPIPGSIADFILNEKIPEVHPSAQ